MPYRGRVYDLVIDLPCTRSSGIRHHAFAVNSREYTARNGLLILISTTTGASYQVRKPFAFFVTDQTVYRPLRGRPFDTDRPVTPTLLGTFEIADLPDPVGEVTPAFFTGEGCRNGYGAEDALRVQLQLPGRMDSLAKLYRNSARDVSKAALGRDVAVERLSIWSVRGQTNPWVIVSNDKNNAFTGYVHGVELLTDPATFYPETPLELGDSTLAAQYFLGPRLRVFCQRGSSRFDDVLVDCLGEVRAENRVNAHLMSMLGLSWG